MEPLPQRKGRLLRAILIVLILAAALVAAYFILTYRSTPPGPVTGVPEQDPRLHLVTWNLYNFGRSKDDTEMAFIARQLRHADLVAVQEVSTSPPGAQAVARLADELGRTGTAWDYVVSDPTTGDGSERYAFLWKASRVRLIGRPWLEASLADALDREPFLARFEHVQTGQRLLVASFHAVPTSKKPEREIRLLDALHTRYTDDHLVLVGDFNLPQDDPAYDGLRRAGYAPALIGQKTSLKMRRTNGEHLASEYDNIFFERAPLRVEEAGVIDFTETFATLREARRISDHLPVYAVLSWN
ncbi:MAG: deoxyribonuclease [Rhodothermaceae bacterium]|nr:MAG: deoxyribonuclease [Rhodothermaceae bacterium]